MNFLRVFTGLACAAALMATPARALNLSTEGVGQVLIFPYYTVNANQDTYVSIANESKNGMVVKVRFLEGRNGRPAADFNLYLAGNDTWAAAVTRSPDGNGVVLTTSDHSCTTPAIPPAGLAFSTAGFDGSGAFPADDAPHDASRIREGSIEVIAGGSLSDGSPKSVAITQAAAGGPDAGQPPGCATLPGSMYADVHAPENGISGSAAVINVAEGQYYAYKPDAIANFTTAALFNASNGPLEPSLMQANSLLPSAGNVATTYLFLDESYSSLGATSQDYAFGIDAVTALFTKDTIRNDYFVGSNLGANTDWVVTYPTRRFYVDPVYGFTTMGSGRTAVAGDFVPVAADRDRGGALPTDQAVVTLPHNNVNVISFLPNANAASPSGVFSSTSVVNLSVTVDAGILRLEAGRYHRDQVMGGTNYPYIGFFGGPLFGEAVTGFMAYRTVNANAQPGRLGNYGATAPYRSTRCTGASIDAVICRY